MTEADDLLTVDEVVPLVRLHKVTIYRLARQGVIESIKQGRRRRFRRSAIDAYLAECAVPVAASEPRAATRQSDERPSRNPDRRYRN